MAPLSSLLTVTLATTATAFSVNSGVATTTASRPSTKLYENFGFDFAEDQAENTPEIILGEANYKKWVNSVDPNNMLNRQVSQWAVYLMITWPHERVLFLVESASVQNVPTYPTCKEWPYPVAAVQKLRDSIHFFESSSLRIKKYMPDLNWNCNDSAFGRWCNDTAL